VRKLNSKTRKGSERDRNERLDAKDGRGVVRLGHFATVWWGEKKRRMDGAEGLGAVGCCSQADRRKEGTRPTRRASKRSAQEKGKNVVAAVVFDCFIPERSRFATATTSSLLVCAWVIVAA
jgi:hypothetical protein